MAVSKAFRTAVAAQRHQAILSDRAISRGMPQMIGPSRWEATRKAYFGERPLTHAQLLEHQMAEAGVE